MNLQLSLGVLDQSPIPEGARVGDALRNSIDLAHCVDDAGYTRYWLAEHHGAASQACASPEAIIGPVAAVAKNLRVGSGGVMLPNYSPLKVAETFNMLNGLYGGRIDLGIGRSPGSNERIAHLLQRDRRYAAPDDFPEQLAELQSWFANERPEVPLCFEPPQLWLLGSSEQSAILAARFGLSYAFADFINPDGARFARWYRERFVASKSVAKPRLAVAVYAICADTDDEALDLSASVRMVLWKMLQGASIPVPPVEKARDFFQSSGMRMELVPVGRRLIIGSPARVRQGLEAVAADYGADEILVITITHDHGARRKSYELIGREFGLKRAS
jgi:luciferase family oxidoreductase group 1